jgi:chromosome partitioning protein
MISVLVANPKGGCGKSTVATNLAAAFAAGGLRTALADADRQRSSLFWLDRRPTSVSPVTGLDWTDGATDVPAGIARLVIDCPAGLRMKRFRGLLEIADAVVVPVLPSPFDEHAAARFIERAREIKAIRKHRVAFGVVRNRVRVRSRAAAHLEAFVGELGATDLGAIHDRAWYTDVAAAGLGIFDLPLARISAICEDWVPMVRFIENLASDPG